MKNKILFITILGLFLTLGVAGVAKAEDCVCACNTGFQRALTAPGTDCPSVCSGLGGVNSTKTTCGTIILKDCICADGTKMGTITQANESGCVSRCQTAGHNSSSSSSAGSSGSSSGQQSTGSGGTQSGSTGSSNPVSGSTGSSNPESGSTGSSNPTSQSATLANPLGNVVSVSDIAGKIIRVIISLLGIISLVMFIYAGFTWLTAGGNATAVKKGKDTMVWAVLGLLVVFSSYILLKFVFGVLSGL